MKQDQEMLKEKINEAILSQKKLLKSITADGRIPLIPGVDKLLVGRIEALESVLTAMKGNYSQLSMF